MIRKPAVPAPAAPRQTFGERMAARTAAAPAQQAKMGLSLEQAMKRGNTFGEQQAGKMAAMEQARQASQNMAPGTGGRGTQQYEAMKQQQAMPSGMAQYGAQMQQKAAQNPGGALPQYGPQTQPPPAILGNRGMAGGMGPTGPGAQTGGPAPMGMAPPNAAKVGMFKKGGKVCYAGGGKAEEKKDPPIPAETLASMKRQAAQEKADRKQAEEQKAGEREVRENMGRIGFKKGGSASSRADGCAIRGKTRA